MGEGEDARACARGADTRRFCFGRLGPRRTHAGSTADHQIFRVFPAALWQRRATPAAALKACAARPGRWGARL